jgi:PAS domain-containing protein
LRGLLDAATEAFFLMDLQGRLLYANEATARLVHTELPAQTAAAVSMIFCPLPQPTATGNTRRTFKKQDGRYTLIWKFSAGP